jgi:hypothetical protein
MKISGILLIIAGLSAIFCGGLSYSHPNQTPDMGLIQVDDTESQQESIPRFWASRALQRVAG